MEQKNKSLANVPIVVMVITVLIILIAPLPTIAVDILISLNLIFAILMFLVVSKMRKNDVFSSFPIVLLLFAIIGLATHICSTRFILIKGTTFDGRLIRAVSFLAGSSGGFIHLTFSFVILFGIIATHMILTYKVMKRISELDHNDFNGALDGAFKFIQGANKMRIIIIIVNILGGTIIGVLLRHEAVNDVLKTYISLSIGNGLLSVVPAYLVTIAAWCIVKRENLR